jgi:hypothetical protein
VTRKHQEKGRLPPFVPLLKETMQTSAWRTMSHGARSLYVALRGRVANDCRNNGRIFLPTRAACMETGSSNEQVVRWFRELQHYGFIVQMVAGHLGVDGQGRAPHWRLTELGTRNGEGGLDMPTRDFLRWNGSKFRPPKTESRCGNPQRCDAEIRNGGDAEIRIIDEPYRCGNPHHVTPKSDAENRCISSNHLVGESEAPRRRDLQKHFLPLSPSSRGEA